MRVRVLFFARLRDLAGCEAMEMEVPIGTTLGELWQLLQAGTPNLRVFTTPPLMARNLEYAAPETSLTGDEEIAFLPPVSGG
jgi:molybdopterin converting factor subunit 1